MFRGTPTCIRTAVIMGFILVVAVAAVVVGGTLEIKYYQGHENGRVKGFDTVDVPMFRAQPMDSKFYTEVWFHEFQFKEQGIIVIVNVQIHNLGLSKGYCDTYITVSDASCGIVVDRSSLSPDEVKVDEEGFGISAGGHRIELVGDEGDESDEYRVKYRGRDIQADFTCKILVPSFQQGDGTVMFIESGDFVRYNFPIPWAEVSGTLTYKGETHNLKGFGSMNHDWQILSPTRFMSDWRAYWMYTDDATISIVRCSSSDLAGDWVQRLMVAERGRILFSSHDYKFEEFEPASVPGSNVPCPSLFRVEAAHGDDWLKGEIRVTRIQEKGNILAEYPYLFRKLALLFVEETWSYRFWMDFKFEFHQDGKTRLIQGKGTGNFVDSLKAD